VVGEAVSVAVQDTVLVDALLQPEITVELVVEHNEVPDSETQVTTGLVIVATEQDVMLVFETVALESVTAQPVMVAHVAVRIFVARVVVTVSDTETTKDVVSEQINTFSVHLSDGLGE
jgi:hypothetical protein